MKIDVIAGLFTAIIVAVLIVAVWVVLKINLAGIAPGSEEITGWGAYGDYFGGLLNPVFAFASFLLLILTIIIQSKELRASRKELAQSTEALKAQKEIAKTQVDHLERQAKKEDLFRMINHVFSEFNELLERNVRIIFINSHAGEIRSVDTYAKNLFGVNKHPHYTGDLKVRDTEKGSNIKSALWKHNELLSELRKYLERYESLSPDDSTVTGYYIKRCAAVVHDMHIYDGTDDINHQFYTRDYNPF